MNFEQGVELYNFNSGKKFYLKFGNFPDDSKFGFSNSVPEISDFQNFHNFLELCS
jgi:hypothetical protein